MLGPGFGVVKANGVSVALCVCLVVLSGCFWRGYPARVRTHAELLVSFAHKARDLVATGRFTAESLPELTYPLERAVAFAAHAHANADTPPPSLLAFDALIARYRSLVELVDQTRRAGTGLDAAQALAEPLAAVDAAAVAVTAALASERGSARR